MRIISQDGKWDLPYDGIVIDKSGAKIFTQSNLISSGDDNYVEIAVYSTPEKAEKAMEMIHEKFNLFELQKVVTKETNDSIIALGTQTDVSKFFNYCFKFPADEEIEV